MGVWERSPEGIRIANGNVGLQADFRRALPDYTATDNVGSAYCVRNYVVDKHLGGPEGLAAARQLLAQHGLRLVLDFVQIGRASCRERVEISVVAVRVI